LLVSILRQGSGAMRWRTYDNATFWISSLIGSWYANAKK